MNLKRELEQEMTDLFQQLDRGFPNVSFGKPKISVHLPGQVEVSGSSVITAKNGGDVPEEELVKIEKRVEAILSSRNNLDLLATMEVGFDYDEINGKVVFVVNALEPDK